MSTNKTKSDGISIKIQDSFQKLTQVLFQG